MSYKVRKKHQNTQDKILNISCQFHSYPQKLICNNKYFLLVKILRFFIIENESKKGEIRQIYITSKTIFIQWHLFNGSIFFARTFNVKWAKINTTRIVQKAKGIFFILITLIQNPT